MSIPIVDMKPKPSLGAAFGEGVAGGLGKLIQNYRSEKIGQQMGAPKGYFSLFDNPADAAKSWQNQKAIQAFQKYFAEDPEQESRQDLGIVPHAGGQQPQGGVQQPQIAPRPRKTGINEQQLAATAGTPFEGVAKTMFEAQQRKAAKEEAIEKEPYVASAKEYFSDLNKKQRNLPATKTALESEIDAIKRGDVKRLSGGTFASIARSFGAPDALAAMLETPGSKQFRTAQKTFLSNTLQETMRGTTSGKQIDLVEGLLAEVGASKEANLASVWLLKTKSLLDEKEIQVANQLRKQGVPSYEIPAMVAEQIEPYRQEISDQYMEAVNSLIKKK